jgi:spore maturation protein CgeB
LWLWLTRERRDIYKNCNTTSEQLNLDYNKSRVVLNVHHEQQKNGANPKVFEIAATRAYQICDVNPYIEELFPNGEIGIYHNEEELFELIDYALSHDMSEQAESARQIVVNNHTFVNRIQQMLNILYSK